MKLVFFVILIISSIFSIKLRVKQGGAPVIHLHIEEPNSEPDETRRIAEESRFQREKIRQLEMKEELDKQGFQQIVTMQNQQIEQLAYLAQLTTQMTAEKITG